MGALPLCSQGTRQAFLFLLLDANPDTRDLPREADSNTVVKIHGMTTTMATMIDIFLRMSELDPPRCMSEVLAALLYSSGPWTCYPNFRGSGRTGPKNGPHVEKSLRGTPDLEKHSN